jgi:hypothetical protein
VRYLFLVAVLLGSRAAAQDSIPLVQYDWHDQRLTQRKPPRTGDRGVIEITGLNRVCFKYSFTINQQTSKDDLSTYAANFKVATPAGGAAKALAPDSITRSVFRADPGEVLLDRISKFSIQAITLLAEADGSTTAYRDGIANLASAITTFYAAACNSGFGRGPNEAGLRAIAATAAHAASAFASATADLQHVDATLVAANAAIDSGKKILQAFNKGAFPTSAALKQRGSDLDDALSAAGATWSTDTGVVNAVKKNRQTALLFDALVKGEAPGVQRQFIAVGDNTDSLVIQVSAQPQDSLPASVKPGKWGDTLHIPVRRRYRFVVSAGFLISGLRQHDYERVNVPNPSAGRDSTYSTFADRQHNTLLAFAPAAIGSLSLLNFDPIEVYASTGVAARSVNNSVSPDFVIGPSVGVRDRVLLTVGLQVGRVERLLIGTPSVIESEPIAPSITQDNAVGVQWKTALAFIFSYRP